VFVTKTRRGRASWRLSETFLRLARGTDLSPIRLHEARHSAGAIWREAGVDFKVIQEWLGHATMAITTDIYSHVRPATHAAAAEKDAWVNAVRRSCCTLLLHD
jgi:integrase